jgi:maltooligosyltrehalose trehalohydrolase
VGNRPFGDRLHEQVGRSDYRLVSLLLLLLPDVPLLFQGQEFLASTPFQYFSDHEPELGKLVTEGRREEFASFAAFGDEATRELIPDPQDPATFARSKLDLAERDRAFGRLTLDLYRELLRIRANDPVLAAYRRARLPIAVSPIETDGLMVGFRAGSEWRLLALNFGRHDLVLQGAEGGVVLDTNEARFGGNGRAAEVKSGALVLPARTAAVLRD